MEQIDGLLTKAGTGFLGAFGLLLVQHGSSPIAFVLALVGAILAALELESLRLANVASVVVFNLIVGVLGGAILAGWAVTHGLAEHQLALLAASFLSGYFGHDLLAGLKPALQDCLRRMLQGNRK